MHTIQSGLARVIKEMREYIALEFKATDAEAKLASTIVAWAGNADENEATRVMTNKKKRKTTLQSESKCSCEKTK
jgi:hypothetical protein